MLSNKNNARKACVVALVAASAASAGAETGFQTRRLKAACRGEEVCLNQVCDPSSFMYNVGAGEGTEFPYDITHRVMGGSIEFKVCPSSSAKAACSGGTGGCSGLSSLKLRMRNDMLSMGRDIVSEPKGRMWASCSKHGPGHEWVESDLGSLTSAPNKSDCETFTVKTAGGKKPSLADVCQQKVKIVENSGWTVVDTTAKPNSCFLTFVTANGRVGYAVVGGDKLAPKKEDDKKDDKEKEETAKAASVETSKKDDASKVTASQVASPPGYGRRAGVGIPSYGRATVSSYGTPAARRRGLRREMGGRRMF